ncbi:MAG: ATP-dependent DNA helicase RecG [Candidatus Muiribacteriota bacterium]
MNEQIFDKDVRFIKNVGPRRAVMLEKLNIKTLIDLIYHIPVRYEDRRNPVKIKNLIEGRESLLLLELSDIREVRARRFKIIKLRGFDGENYIDIVFFNQAYLKKNFQKGVKYYFYGKPKRELYGFVLNSPDFEKEDGKNEKIVPVYALTKGISQKVIKKIILNAFNEVKKIEIPDYLPQYLKEKYGFFSPGESLFQIHFPEDFKKLNQALDGMKFREIFYLQTAFFIISFKKKILSSKKLKVKKFLDKYKKVLPFKLTNDQSRVIDEIAGELEAQKNVNRLLQGDVGSGKTAVVMFFLIAVVLNKYKSIFMAPTEVLSKQHFKNIKIYADKFNIKTILLTGGNYKGKRGHEELIASDSPCIIIGTHALIQKKLNYGKTGIIIIDEQHRFGVAQRMELSKKTGCKNIIVMSATPIPRTLALTSYGDMDFSNIREKPARRKEVKTYLRDEKALTKIYNFINEKINKFKEKAFIVTPLIEESQKMDLKAAEQVYKELSEKYFIGKCGILHGRMKSKEKEKIMEQFINGDIYILISTTVIEVGVDVPEATVMVIKNAERFGLAQLHQLRGRVGRSHRQSYCVLVHSENISSYSMKRLHKMEETFDGFELAEEDMKLRGTGEFFGSRQHGFGNFKFINPVKDSKLIEASRKEVSAMFKIYKYENIPENLKNYIKNIVLKKWEIL